MTATTFSLTADGMATPGLVFNGPATGSRRKWELGMEAEVADALQVAPAADAPARLPRALMLGTVEKVAGPKPPSGLPKLFPEHRQGQPPRLGHLDALAWGYADTTPLQDALLAWLACGHGANLIRQAIIHRARQWPMSSGRRDLIIDTAMTHAPAPTYSQYPPAWLNYQTDFVKRVNQVLRWINHELSVANRALSLTKIKKIGPKCYNGIIDSENAAPFFMPERLRQPARNDYARQIHATARSSGAGGRE